MVFVLFFIQNQLISSVHVLVTQLCPTLCSAMDCSPPGSPVHGILQARILDGLPFPTQILLTQESNLRLLCLLHWQVDPLTRSHCDLMCISFQSLDWR